jgi:hypothetical protein
LSTNVLSLLSQHWWLAAVVAAFLVLLARWSWVRLVNARFGVSRVGGRGGKLLVKLPTFVAQVEFEVGATVDLIVYRSTLSYASGAELPAGLHGQVVSQLQAWAAARRLSLEAPDTHAQARPAAA